MMVLLRHLLGDVLRQLRQRQGRTLREVSADARVSLGYLSSRTRTEGGFSELLASICGALGVPLSRFFERFQTSHLAELQEAALSGSVPADSAAGPDRLGIDSTIPDRVPEVVDMVGV